LGEIGGPEDRGGVGCLSVGVREQAEAVQGASDAAVTAVQDVGVDHGGLDAAVAEEFLDGADVVTVFEQVGVYPQGVVLKA
jgi:hypothetical protein